MAESSEDPHLAFKLTRGTSCVLCQQRKVRCEKAKPCTNCVKANIECRVIPPAPPRRRKKRVPERDLVARLRKYEDLLTRHGIQFEPMGDFRVVENVEGYRAGGGMMMMDGGNDGVESLRVQMGALKTEQRSPRISDSPDTVMSRSSKRANAGNWFNFHREFLASEELFDDSSEDDADDSTAAPRLHRGWARIYKATDSFPFFVGSSSQSITHLHPTPVQIIQLWQVFIMNVNPLCRLCHVPTMQLTIIEASNNLKGISPETEALMFAIYLISVVSLNDDSCMKMFGTARRPLMIQFHGACQQAMINASLMRTSDLAVLTAFSLYLIAVRQFMDPRQIYTLSGMAIRISHRLGLHRDPAQFGISPFECEIRRRLWFCMAVWDRRLAEMTGSPVSVLSTGGDVKPPLNINDADLHIEAKVPPTPHVGATEMTFALSRYEFGLATTGHNGGDGEDGAGPVTKDTVITLPFHEPRIKYTVEGFIQHHENTYLRYCDSKIPVHYFTSTLAKSTFCKFRVISFLIKMSDPENTSPNSALADHERDQLFLECVQMIEYDNIIHSSPQLQPYRWFTYIHFPISAYMFLVSELRRRTVGPTVTQAWQAINANQVYRGEMNMLHSPSHQVFGNLFCKAWDAHEAGMTQAGYAVEEPEWITKLRSLVIARKREKSGSASGSGSVGSPPLPMAASGQGTETGTGAGTREDMEWNVALEEYRAMAQWGPYKGYVTVPAAMTGGDGRIMPPGIPLGIPAGIPPDENRL